MIAAERGHSGLVALLLERGAIPASVDRDGRKAEDLAATQEIRELLRRQ
jgi:ankyrin repeat protein